MGSGPRDGGELVTLSELGAIGEFLGSILTLITLVYLAIQVRQNTRHVQAQMGHDGWLSVKDDQIAVMGDDAAEALAKVGLDNEPLTDRARDCCKDCQARQDSDISQQQ